MTVDAKTLLKYINLQMASEAFLDQPGSLEQLLIAGNGRASSFTDTLATKFVADGWTVVEQQGNTSTGFSGTLFRNTTTGELVLSFRSTEFVDDAARDSQQTNQEEISDKGWAFGQIDDMQTWYAHLQSSGLIDRPVTVTGYSLGAHLATAFTLMRIEQGHGADVAATYTFNGAGVGDVATTVTASMALFHSLRGNASSLFQTVDGTLLYNQLKALLGNAPTVAQLNDAQSTVQLAIAGLSEAAAIGPISAELVLLASAIDRAKSIRVEVDRVNAGITDPNGPPASVPASDVAGLRLDYQLAVLCASQTTSSYRTGLIAGIDGYAGRNQKGVLPNFYDVYGDTTPSSVTNSQWHYGEPVPVFIEDQPLWRGSFLSDFVAQSYAYNGVKLLVPDFTHNNFGDTHSIVLQVDSLVLQDAIATLAPNAQLSTLSNIFKSASNSRAKSGVGPGNQGDAEGDTLERVVDALTKLLVNPNAAPIDASAQMIGGTWSDLAYRNTFAAAIQTVTTSAAYLALVGKVTIDPSDLALAASARNNFSSLATLIALSPFALKAADSAGQTLLDQQMQAIWGSVYTTWQTDKTMSQADIQSGRQGYTDRWLADRALFLQEQIRRNLLDVPSAAVLFDKRAPEDALFLDAATATSVNVSHSGVAPDASVDIHVTFGSNFAESISGAVNSDRLYAGDGNDTVFGLDGNDYVEGNGGSDALYGGSGNDTILGGAGTDTLEGGLGSDSLLGGDGIDQLDGGSENDLLLGGNDADRYFFSSAWGQDVIDDSDGQGVINVLGFGAVDGSGTTKADNVWTSADKKINYALLATDASHNDLLITFQGVTDTIRITDWSPTKNLGITLTGVITPPPPPSHVFNGDYNKAVDGSSYRIGSDGNYVPDGPLANAADEINGTAGDDEMRGFGGNDGLSGQDGDDYIDGGSGRDVLLGGYGADTILGGDDADTIFGSDDGYFTLPKSTSFVLPPSPGTEYARGFSWASYLPDGATTDYIVSGAGDILPNGESDGNLIDGGSGDDKIYAGWSDDTVHGGADNDEINGMGGNDVLFGDNGDDYIRGDGSAGANGAYTPSSLHGNDLISGGAGNDTLIGQGGSDEVYGGDGDDVMSGDDNGHFEDTPLSVDGNDTLDGGAGNDSIGGDGGDDDLYGGTGNDEMFGDSDPAKIPGSFHGNDYLDGEDGDDFLDGGGKDDTLFGGSGNDTMWGDSNQPGLASADLGNDYLDGGDGNDVEVGGGKDDTLFGGKGDDALYGDGDDAAASDQGNDYIDGESGDDAIYGNGGNDTALGGDGGDSLYGGDGDDYLDGGNGIDLLTGDAGNDTLVGGGGVDDLEGGAGDDTYIFSVGDSRNDNLAQIEGITDNEGHSTIIVDGADIDSAKILTDGNGTLVLAYSANDWLAVVNGVAGVDASYQVFGGNYTTDELIGALADAPIEADDPDGHHHIVGGRRDDQIVSNKGGADVSGGKGNDTIVGSGGSNNYRFSRGDGADRLTDTSAKTNLSGQPTPNSIVFGAGITASDIRLTGASGQLTVNVGDSANPDSITFGSFDQGSNTAVSPIDRFVFADGTSLTYAELVARGFDGGSGDDVLSGTSAGDRISGGGGNDLLLGLGGNDTLLGGEGNDTLTGGVGIESLVGGAGDDTYSFAVGDSAIASGGEQIDDALGHNTIAISGVAASALQVQVASGALVVTYSGNDRVSIVGGVADVDDAFALADRTYSTAELVGAVSTSVLQADDASGHRHLLGGKGNDTISWAAGSATFSGGRGNDTLVGNGGSNTYLYSLGDGSDTLTDTSAKTSAGQPTPNRIVFGAGIAASDLRLSGAAGQFRVQVGNDPNDGITFGSFDQTSSSAVSPIDSFVFSDRSTLSFATLLARGFEGGSGDDVIAGTPGADRIAGHAGNDSLAGQAGDDTLDGGAGNDTLVGGAGNDVYLFGLGGGHDVIDNTDAGSGKVDTLRLSVQTPTDIAVAQSGSDLTVSIQGTSDSIVLKN